MRRRASDNARYGFHWNDESTFKWEIKFDGVPTAQTRIVGSAAGTAPQLGDTLRVEARGNVIKGFHNGVEVVSATDTDQSAKFASRLSDSDPCRSAAPKVHAALHV